MLNLPDSFVQPLTYLGLLLGILVVPKALQRFRIPGPITCLFFGIAISLWGGDYHHDKTLTLLSVFGIASVFLFAGLEVSLSDLIKYKWPIFTHLLLTLAIVAVCALLAMKFLALSWQAATLVALALFIPSTGFILDSLSQFGLNESERFWVALKAITSELLALVLMFIALQSDSVAQLALSSGIMLAMAIAMPFLFLLFGRIVLPYAPNSEFTFLVLMGVIAASVTKELGVYYLVGAFLVGFLARQLREHMPSLASDSMLQSVKLFASFFVPFYFFHGGISMPVEALNWQALWLGIGITAVVLPLRVLIMWGQRRAIFNETFRSSLHVSITLAPTLIFTLVLAGILRERFALDETIYGALLVYAMLTTIVPSFLLPKAINFDLPEDFNTVDLRKISQPLAERV
ncbi:MAG: cation:proton antiporter [Oxalobacteraceae bacterium]